jgi:hypothetical protein
MGNSVSLVKLQSILSRYDVEEEQRRDIMAAVEREFGHEIKDVKALASATGSVTCPINPNHLWEINELAQLVIHSRQNVGTVMKEQARKVKGIIQSLNSNQPSNS